MDALFEAGYEDVHFYNADLLRPSASEMVDDFIRLKPDIIGISAVVSTSYAFVKSISSALKEKLPSVPIIVGGNLAAVSDVLLKRTSVDLCAIGEGEETIVSLCRHFQKYGPFEDNDDLRSIKGIVYKGQAGSENDLVVTGRPSLIAPDKIRQPNYHLLDGYYLRDLEERIKVAGSDILEREPHRRDKKIAYVELSKGCVNKCTFCHRWVRGYRVIPIEQIISHIEMLVNDFNVGYIAFGDENFGSSRRQLEDFLDRLEKLDILWHVIGMRVTSVEPEIINRMKKAGCLGIYFGIESGSRKMLSIMEKNTLVQDNLNALKVVMESGLHTIIQLVIGMPGESNETILETIDFLKKVQSYSPEEPVGLSTNWAQALPGTPLYDYARAVGEIGAGIDGEEEYLLKISDTNATQFSHFINMTEEPLGEAIFWKLLIYRETLGCYMYPNVGQAVKINRLLLGMEKIVGRKIMKELLTAALLYKNSRKPLQTLKHMFLRKKRASLPAKSLRQALKNLSPQSLTNENKEFAVFKGCD